ncbi:MAG: MBL fold metallo-hydrolase [Phycisphaerales bacterium]|nr:MBL fold metallo-hydrolase [Phycisphaerales bacterium]
MDPSNPDPPRYDFKLLRAGRFKLDGGSMFGLIPRVVWARAVGDQVDGKGRIPVQHNCLLLTAASGGGHAFKRVVIETGTGNKLDQKSREIFDLEQRWLGDALAEAGVSPDDIDAVLVSHLHFDHAGGLTRLCESGERPDWTGPASGMAGSRPDHGVRLTFPRAPIYVQAREWRDALQNTSVMTRTYFTDHLGPLRDRVRLLESPPPFSPGIIPLRDQLPAAPASLRLTPILDDAGKDTGIRTLLVPGHTWGQQAILFTDRLERTIVFTPDVLPTAWHVGQAYSLGYDVEPYTSSVSRRWFLSEAADHNWVLVLDHEPGNPLRSVKRNPRDWFELVPVES